ncbi:glycine--tRNA ligase subunit beta [Brevibacillus humidisoli]|uniref:glycine--tRNA ligase subunit beta n=1 Tax=Brevibacillus humidisoli TaxID=2895522 RepID=UPI001E408868|nr:glycine--tRNA ligase subunit beta [Brevibacillus humidisoli]UFJ43143.1 glycine--tRNA ligase subunit beta [Brevibacillus humidisoli]
MSKHDLLLEIGLEEIPARFIATAVQQLAEKVEKWFGSERIAFERIETYESPRRLALLVTGVAERQADVNAEARGPALKIARDEAGNWTKAALGFARSNGVDPEQLEIKEHNGVEYIYARKSETGQQTSSRLPLLADVILSLHFPKNMRWGASDIKFVRPIRWLVALFGDQVVEMEIAGVKTGRTSHGHRSLGSDVEIGNPAEYVSKLKEQYVLVDPVERRERIVRQLQQLEKEQGWRIPIDKGLLDEVVHLVEYPTALYGTFDSDFLAIPRDVLVTSMREHQRYFPVENETGELLPHFVTVRNGDARSLENVARGNEKVLRARLSDARFFYEEDQKRPIADCLKRLESIVFHEELGTIGDKVRRIGKLTEQMASRLTLDTAEAKTATRVAEIAKFDLVTQMVYEFPELQGIMGEDYARKAGEPEAVARGVFEHYLPRFSGDELPSSQAAAVVSVADKLDTIVGCFLIGIIPTGSQDPYALRRQAAGIVQILLDRGWTLPLDELFEMALAIYHEQGVDKRPGAEVKRDLFDFFALRLKNVLQEAEIRYDVIDAVLAADVSLVGQTVAKAKALMAAVQTDAFKLAVEQFNRVFNLAQKAESQAIDAELFQETAERQLAEAHQAVSAEVESLYQHGDMERVLETLTSLSEPIQQFFEQVMVMADDPQIRSNRLALLQQLSSQIQRYADFTKLVFA